MPRPADTSFTPPSPPPPPSLRGWVLVPAGEPGLLHRARSVVRTSRDLVLVSLDPAAATPARARLGVGLELPWTAPRPGRLVWFGDLTALETAAVLEWIAGPVAGLATVPAALRHRVTVVQPAAIHPQGQPRP
ncbi:hypothetical protein [Kineococcus rhizosphaerae]|uniref:Uncharacterized protein n=1 Tax=Kineococcus rhizosphaerae TaxID=559628 RepID=A0A2T0QZT0_9ACTN|nr:hypothetical protein [Kineococcus rhizosphaerae]PRY12171.1 hypothetical protein CLV37_111128 [Kineococcus rhizosphaerae]